MRVTTSLSLGNAKLQSSLLHLILKQSSGCSGNSFSRMGAGLGLCSYKEINVQGKEPRGAATSFCQAWKEQPQIWEAGMGEEGWRRAAQK